MRDEGEAPAGPPSWRQRWVAAGLLLLTIGAAAATVVVWRADAADQRGDYARALWWRPGVPLYQRQMAETLLFTDPAAAQAHLLRALRVNPYDPEDMDDLNTVDLALGSWPRALALTRSETDQQQLNYAARWRLANLYLAHADLPAFWQEMKLAARTAPASAFAPMSSRALTASGYDFASLRRALPPDSVPAAAAFAAAAADRGDRAACAAAADWLLGLPAAPGPITGSDAREQALLQLLAAAWQRWPADAAPLETRLAAAGVLPTALSAAAFGPRDANFDPRLEAAARRLGLDAGADLSAILGWRWPTFAGLDAHQVETGDARHPTAAYLGFDGSEADQGLAGEQWVLLPGGTVLNLSAWTRRLDSAPSGGVSLQLARLDGSPLAALALAPGDTWQRVTASWRVPGNALQTLRLQIVYRRPVGQMALHNRLLLTGIEFAPAGESK